MKRFTLIFLSLFVAYYSFAQSDSTHKDGCSVFNETIDSNNYDKYIDTLDNQDLIHSIAIEEYRGLIDCLLSFDPAHPKLNFYKAVSSESESINDTSAFAHYRISVANNYKKGESYYNMGAFYINQLLRWKEDNSVAIFDFLKEEREKYFNLAEKYMWLSYKSGIKESVFAIGNIQNYKSEYIGLPKQRINIDQDTLIIVTKINDCGEFGGHVESVNLINTGEGYNAYFYSDSIFCMNEITKASINSKHNGENVIVSKADLRDFIEVINSYAVDDGIFSNAPVEIAIIRKEEILLYQRIEDSSWPYYLDFRMKIFGI